VLARVQDSTATEPAAAPARPEAAARSSGGWLVQIGTFGQKGNAERLSGALQKSGFDAFVSPTSRGEKTLYRVRVGPAGAKDEATQLAGRLGAAGHQGQVVPQ
jgi:cell division septation protein DedD